MSMTFLQLCARARQEAGIPGTGPTTVINQTGALGRLVGWVAQAWVDIQILRPNWNFMWEEFSFDTIAATRDYLASDQSINNLSLWDVNSFLIYLTATGTSDQTWLPYDSFSDWRKDNREKMASRDDNRPQLFTIMPNNKLRFEPRPNAIYTIEGEYKRVAQNFTANADVPTNLPDDFHMIIVWMALTYYGYHLNAPEVLDEAETNFSAMLLRLENEQLPEMSEEYRALA